MIETDLILKAPDGALIYGVLARPEKKSEGPKKLLILGHGFTGHPNEHIFFNAASYFTEREFTITLDT